MDRQRRAVGIRVPLTAEQRAAIRESTGQDIDEVVMVGDTSSSARLENEVTTQFDTVLAQIVSTANERFQKTVENDRIARTSRPTQEAPNAPYHLPSLAYARAARQPFSRVTALRVPFTEAQRAKLKATTGSDATEALIVCETSVAEPLDHEITSELDLALARTVWAHTGAFRGTLAQDDAAKRAEAEFNTRVGVDSPPHLVVIR